MAIGEMLPRYENAISLHPKKRDAWGIPVAKISCSHSDNERMMVADMNKTITELAHLCGFEIGLTKNENPISQLIYKVAAPLVYTKEGALVPGSAIHEAGGACMGRDPNKHILNQHNQCYDANNVFVTDSACFPSSPFQNPGLTIMALSARAGNFIADQLDSGKL